MLRVNKDVKENNQIMACLFIQIQLPQGQEHAALKRSLIPIIVAAIDPKSGIWDGVRTR